MVKILHRTKETRSEALLTPSFDHVLKDPCLDGVSFTLEVSIVILEGNWVLLDEDPWREISGLVDDTWFVDVEPELAKDRVARRHPASGIETKWEDAVRRAENNDLVNGDDVRTRRVMPLLIVQSVEEPEEMPSFFDSRTAGNNPSSWC